MHFSKLLQRKTWFAIGALVAFSQVRHKLGIGFERAHLLIALIRVHEGELDFAVGSQENNVLHVGFLEQPVQIKTFD